MNRESIAGRSDGSDESHGCITKGMQPAPPAKKPQGVDASDIYLTASHSLCGCVSRADCMNDLRF
jgi:hypothetical protein